MNEIVNPDTLAEEHQALDMARALTINSDEDYRRADSLSVGLLSLEKKIKADFKDSKAAAVAAHKALCSQENGHLDAVSEARKIIRPKLLAWEEHKRKESEREAERLREIAKKQAEDRAISEAAEAESNGDHAAAKIILGAPVVVSAVVVAPSLPKRHTRIPEAWTYRITNPHLIPREYLTEDAAKLNGVARATKGSINVPGVSFYDKNRELEF